MGPTAPPSPGPSWSPTVAVRVSTPLSTTAGGSGTSWVEHQTETHTIEQEVLVWPIVVAGLVGLLVGGLGGYWLGQSLVYVGTAVAPAPVYNAMGRAVAPAPAAPIYNAMARVRQNRMYIPTGCGGTEQLYDEPENR